MTSMDSWKLLLLQLLIIGLVTSGKALALYILVLQMISSPRRKSNKRATKNLTTDKTLLSRRSGIKNWYDTRKWRLISEDRRLGLEVKRERLTIAELTEIHGDIYWLSYICTRRLINSWSNEWFCPKRNYNNKKHIVYKAKYATRKIIVACFSRDP